MSQRCLEVTPDHRKFPLVIEENINYGFRRTFWGMKPYGLTIAGLFTLAIWGLFLSEVVVDGGGVSWYEPLFAASDPRSASPQPPTVALPQALSNPLDPRHSVPFSLTQFSPLGAFFSPKPLI